MADFKIPGHGEICWRELRTKDVAAANDFYTKLFGWTTEQSKATKMDYKEIVIDGEASGGMLAIDESWGPEPPPSHWATYIAVADADATAEKIVANGGKVNVPPFDTPGVGRIALVADPAGADFALIQFTDQPAG